MSSVKGKHVMITGAASGIGRAIALRLAGDGARVALTDRDADRLAQTFEEVRSRSPESIQLTLDVTDEQQINRCVQSISETFGSIDVLANNAGVSSMAKFTEITEEEWDWNMDVNLKSVWRVTKHVAPVMMKQKRGTMVVTASMASKIGAPLLAHYAASKFGVIGYVQSIAKELAEYGVTVNAVCPGFVQSPMQDREVIWEAKLRGIDDPEKVRKEYIDMTPLGRLCQPEDVANVVSFLASDDAGFMTGQSLNVTGGICAH